MTEEACIVPEGRSFILYNAEGKRVHADRSYR